MNQINPEDLGEICKHAYLLRRRRGDAVMCEESLGKKGDECICTTSCNLGHLSPEAFYETDKMFECKYRKAEE